MTVDFFGEQKRILCLSQQQIRDLREFSLIDWHREERCFCAYAGVELSSVVAFLEAFRADRPQNWHIAPILSGVGA